MTAGGPGPHVHPYDDAIIVPPLSAMRANATGVLHNGAAVEQAVTYRGPHPAHAAPPNVAPVAEVAGTWLWGGQLYRHFGHFLTESAARLWAFGQTGEDVRGVIFTPKRFAAGDTLLKWQTDYLAMAGVAAAVHVATTPTKVERLLVAAQGFGTGDLSAGTDAYKAFFRDRFAADIAPDGPERLYLSRSRFGPRKGGVLGEDVIEAALAAEGYEIFHPQDHPLDVQIAHMKAARRIVGPDGSAFHLAGLVARPDVRAAAIMRRNTAATVHLQRQFKGLRGARLLAMNAIRRDWTPGGAPPDRLSFAELDFAVLSRALRRGGLIDREGWKDPAPDAVAKRIRQLSRRRGVKLEPAAPPPRQSPA